MCVTMSDVLFDFKDSLAIVLADLELDTQPTGNGGITLLPPAEVTALCHDTHLLTFSIHLKTIGLMPRWSAVCPCVQR